MADKKDKPSKEVAIKNDDVFNVANLIAKAPPPSPKK